MFIHRYARRPSSLTGCRTALTFAVAVLLCLPPAAVEKSAHAATTTSEIQVSLTIRDVCTMDTDTVQPQVACSSGAPFRVYRDGFFAQANEQALGVFVATAHEGSVEIAF